MFNLQKRKSAVVEKLRQLVIHFIQRALAVDRITPQENFIMLAPSNLRWHGSNSSSCIGQRHHCFCLANLVARCESGPACLCPGQWGEGQGSQGKPGGEIEGPGTEGCLPAPVSLCSLSPPLPFMKQLPCFDVFLFLHESDLHVALTCQSPSLPSLDEALSTLTLCTFTYACVPFCRELPVLSSDASRRQWLRKRREALCSVPWHASFRFYWWLS